MFGMLPGAGERKCLSKRHKNVFAIYWWHPTPVLFCLENPMDGGLSVHGVAESWTRLSVFTFTFHFHALEEEMATHSSVLAWRIPGMVGPGGLPSLGSHRVGHELKWLSSSSSSSSSSSAVYIFKSFLRSFFFFPFLIYPFLVSRGIQCKAYIFKFHIHMSFRKK